MAKTNTKTQVNITNFKKKFRYGEFKCTLCSKLFTEKGGLTQHIQTHSSDKPFSCHLCPHTCKTKKYLSRHIRKVHIQAKEHECSVCGLKFHYKCLLKRHMYIHTDERPYKCNFCGKGFNSNYSLNTHKFIHSESKPFKCEFCDYACRDSSTLRKHHEKHMGIKHLYQCKICDKNCTSKSLLKLHITEVHFDIDVRNTECKQCGKMFKSNSALNTHIKVVHKKMYACKCDVCGMKLSNKYNLSTHVATHFEFKPFKCKFEGCGKKFKDKGSLKKHILIHYPEQQFECELCHRRFARKHRLTTHKKQHELKEKTVFCDYCGKSFYNKNYLSNHILRKHIIKEEYICDTCGLCAHNRSSIIRHIRRGHDMELDRQCKICKKVLKKHAYLKLHYWNTHSIRYKLTRRRPKEKKQKVKDESKYIELTHEVKVEPQSDFDGEPEENGEETEITLNAKIPEKFEDFYTKYTIKPGMSYVQDTRIKKDENIDIDVKCQNEANKCIKKAIEDMKRKREMRYIEKIRRDYNRRMRAANLSLRADKPNKIIQSKYHQNKQTEKQNNGDINENNRINIQENEENSLNSQLVEGNNEESLTNDDLKSNETKQDSKLKINTHQCYVCFKLYETKEKLIDHCHEHFDVCNISMLKKCPLCDYVTKQNLPRHMLKVHKVHIKTLYGTLKNKTDGSTFYYNVTSNKIKEIEVIPSVENLNKRASMDLDKKKRELNNKNITKTKLIKKNGEWIVEKEKIDAKLDNFFIPKLTEQDKFPTGTDDYVGRLKKLYQVAKSNGQKMLFPCENCEKICQTLSALKLHTRKHETNPKPFKKKVWKHKISEVPVAEKSVNEPVNKSINKPISNNRYQKPKPIVNKHKCDDKLKEFYENNIKGGDVEFWQFLKIFNRMSRENINDFADLESRTEFGIHFSLPQTENEVINTEIDKHLSNPTTEIINKSKISKRINKNNSYKRSILISRKEHEKRKRLIEELRQKNTIRQ